LDDFTVFRKTTPTFVVIITPAFLGRLLYALLIGTMILSEGKRKGKREGKRRKAAAPYLKS